MKTAWGKGSEALLLVVEEATGTGPTMTSTGMSLPRMIVMTILNTVARKKTKVSSFLLNHLVKLGPTFSAFGLLSSLPLLVC